MFGNHIPKEDVLKVQVYAISNAADMEMAKKVWNENGRNVRIDPTTGKEVLHFGYNNPRCVVWLQRDQHREDTVEFIVHWQSEDMFEVFVLNAARPQTGDDRRLQELLQSMLLAPSIVPSN